MGNIKCLKKGIVSVLCGIMAMNIAPVYAGSKDAKDIAKDAVNIAFGATEAYDDLVGDKAVEKGSTPVINAYPQLGSEMAVVQGFHVLIKWNRELEKGESIEIIPEDKYGGYSHFNDGDTSTQQEWAFYGVFGKNPVNAPGKNDLSIVSTIKVYNIQKDIEFTMVAIGEHSYLKKGETSSINSIPISEVTSSVGKIEIKGVKADFDVSNVPDALKAEAPKPQSVKQGDKLKDPGDPSTLSNPKDVGYEFVGWFKEPDTSKNPDQWNFDKDTVEKDITLYPGYKPLNDGNYIIIAKDEDGRELTVPEAERTKTGLTFGNEYTVNAPNITGYEPTEQSKKIKLIDYDQEVEFSYKAKKDVPYVVHHYLEGTKDTKVADDEEGTGTFNSTVSATAKDIPGHQVVGAKTQNLKLDGYDKSITFFYKAVDSKVSLDIYQMNPDGTYPDKPTTTAEYKEIDGSPVLVGSSIELNKDSDVIKAGNKANQFEFDPENKDNVLKATVDSVDGVSLKAYYKRVTHKFTFDTSNGPEEGNTVKPVDPQDVPFGGKAQDPGAPELSDPLPWAFDGWYPEGSDKPWDFQNDTAPEEGVVLKPKWHEKTVELRLLKDKDILKRALVDIGDIPVELKLDGEVVTDEKELDKVELTADIIADFDKIEGLEVADIEKTGMGAYQAKAKYSGVTEVMAHYRTTDSSNVEAVVVPGDINRDGYVNISDCALVAGFYRGKQEVVGKYDRDLCDMNGDGRLNITDCAIMAQMIRGKSEYNNSFKKL